ncbi:four helix bundle protein [Chryseobacterium joostei]|uniref:Four helix bundle protein n=1 Tax=Chryseobacterium joostei TaxID=112234 RepID=A0A1N7IAY6_9FLAO|nr:four helix bundle protein [Chryseobacterium joostei]SIS34152.1 four helix bundle protein [Chryseobacterium joostei]
MSTIKFHQDLKVFQKSFQTAQHIYELSKSFPKEELYSLTDQIRRSSRSVTANISEAWEKGDMKNPLLLSLQTPREKQEKPKHGFNLLMLAAI